MDDRFESHFWAAKRLSRRALMRSVGLGCGLAIASVACSARRPEQPSPSISATAKQPKRGGAISYAGGIIGSGDLTSNAFDPHVTTSSGARAFTFYYERLVAYAPLTYTIAPELAQKWEQPSPTEYVFHLQPNVKWQNKAPVNGRALTSEDVVWSLERARTNDPRFVSRSLLASVDKIEARDGQTVRITTREPDASTLTKLSTESLAMLAREAVEKYPKLNTAESAIGTGPFMMQSVEQNVAAEYVHNPDYWKPGRPYLDGVRTRNFGDLLSAWSAFVSGQVDVSHIPAAEVKAYVAKQGAAYQPSWAPDDTLGSWAFPNTKVKPMDDPRVTRALRLLIDHDEFISAWAESQHGRGGYASAFPIAFSDWDLTQAEYKTALEWKQPKDEAAKEALSLLAAAGYSKDNPLKFTIDSINPPDYQAAVQLLQAQWKRLSQGVVDTQAHIVDSATATGIRANRSFTYGYYGVAVGPVEPDLWLTSAYHSGGSSNFMGLSDPQLDTMIDKQRGIFDAQQRKAAIRAIVTYMIDHAPSTQGAGFYYIHAVQPKVQGYTPEVRFINARQYQDVWLSA